MVEPIIEEKSELRIALCGIGGYGDLYLRVLLTQAAQHRIRLVGVADPNPGGCSQLADLAAFQIPIFESLEEFYSESSCDLMILATPIHLHCQQTCWALAQGSHVLCEKPLCASVDQIKLMEKAEQTTGKTVTIGYQWSFSKAIISFKKDYLEGRFGGALRLRSVVCWPRDEYYYRRNEWAGRQVVNLDNPILDSPVNNAGAHYLHNMLYVLGPETNESALPKHLAAELWRVNLIENYDTAALRIELESGAELLFYASHATENSYGPFLSYEFEKATVEYDSAHGSLIARMHDGSVIDYGSPDADPFEKLWNAIDSARTGKPSICGIPAAKAHAICVSLAQNAANGIRDFPESDIRTEHSGRSLRRYVDNLQQIIGQCYRDGKMLSENEEFNRMVWAEESEAFQNARPMKNLNGTS